MTNTSVITKAAQSGQEPENSTPSQPESSLISFAQACSDPVIVVASGTKRLHWANAPACQLFGYSVEQFRSLGFAQLSAQEEGTTLSTDGSAEAGPQLREFRKFLFKRADGSTFSADVSVIREAEHRDLLLLKPSLEKRTTDRAIRRLAQGSITGSGCPLFEELAQQITETLEVENALVLELRDTNRMLVRASTCASLIPVGSELELKNSPLERVAARGFHCVARDAFKRFPESDFLHVSNTCGFTGVSLKDCSGATLGAIAILSREPLAQTKNIRTILDLFAIRASAGMEIERSAALLKTRERNKSNTERMANIGSWEFSLRQKSVRWSEETYRIFGVSPESFTPSYEGFLSLLHPEDRERMRHCAEVMLSSPQPSQVEFRIIRPNGEERFIRECVELELDHNGEPVRLSGICQDITEEKRARMLIDSQNSLFKLLLDSLPAWISYVDRDLKYRIVNRGYEIWFGRPRSEIVGRSVLEVMGESLFQSIRPHLEAALKGATVQYEQWAPSPAGKSTCFDVHYVPHQLSGGHVDGIFVLVTDITDRRESEAAMRHTLDLLENAEQVASMGCWEWNPGENRLLLSPGAVRLAGLAQNPAGHPLDDFLLLLTDGDQEVFLSCLNRNQREESEAGKRISLQRKDGAVREIELRTSRSEPADGRESSVSGTFRDVTVEAGTERLLQELTSSLEAKVRERTARLHAANEELEAFSYSVSHDLKTPLQAILGFSTALMDELGETLSSDNRQNLGLIISSARRMAQIIEDLLKLAHLGSESINRREVDLGAIAQQALSRLRATDSDRNVQFECCQGMTAMADPGLASVIFENLIGNAWKFTANCKEARIEVGVIQHESGGPAFYVKDNGIGFDQRLLRGGFKPFQKLHRDQTYKGHGVGMSIVQKVVRKHGGSLWCESKPGSGATFYFTLPG